MSYCEAYCVKHPSGDHADWRRAMANTTYDVSMTFSRRLRDGRVSLASRGVEDLVLGAPRLALVLIEDRTGGGGVGPSEDNWSEWSSLVNSS